LRYRTRQSVLGAGNCGDHSSPLTMHHVGEKLGEIGEKWSDFDPQRKRSYFGGSGLWCKVSSKLSAICDRWRGDRQADRQTGVTQTRVASDFIIFPMLCYSNGTDNNNNDIVPSPKATVIFRV